MFGCPVELTLDRIGGEWKTIILAHLKQAPMRYGELRSAIPALSDKMLSQRLHELVDLGLIEIETIGASRRYRLSEHGESLRPVLQALYDWGLAQSAPRTR